MPNAKVLSEKQAIVAELVERLKGASAGVFVDYKGITVSEDTALRSELRQNDVLYTVVKNTLVRRALDDCGLSELDGILNGTTSLATSAEDPIVPIRLIHDAAEKMKDKFTIKGAFLEGKVLNEAEIAEISALQNNCRTRTPCTPRYWAPCWLPSPASPLSWARSSSRRAALSRAPSPLRKKPLPNNAATTYSLKIIGGLLSWLVKKSML